MPFLGQSYLIIQKTLEFLNIILHSILSAPSGTNIIVTIIAIQ